jgi:hypothetical protein
MVAERQAAPSLGALRRVPQHPLGGHETFGLCPASLLLVPLSDYDAAQLEEQAQAIERMLAERDRPDSPFPPMVGKSPEPKRPKGRDWFRQINLGGGGRGGGHQGYEPMEQVLLPGDAPSGLTPSLPTQPPAGDAPAAGPSTNAPTTRQGGSGVASVSEVKATIQEADRILAEQIDKLFALEGELTTAARLLNAVRQTSVDPMGLPQVRAAIEQIGEANAMLRQAIEENTTYMGTM